MSQEQGKVKLRGQIATEQEKLLGDRDTELERTESTLPLAARVSGLL